MMSDLVTSVLTENMDISNFQINLDCPKQMYHAGQLVTGNVKITVTTARTLILCLSITIKSTAKVAFFGYKNLLLKVNIMKRGKFHFKGKQVFYYKKDILIGGSEGPVDITKGKHAYYFSARLPHNIPSSFEGQFGYIRYTATATLQRPWKIDQKAKTFFSVTSPLDLSNEENAKKPVLLETRKKLWTLMRSQQIHLIVYMPCAGFIPGQSILLNIRLVNNSRCNVRGIKIALHKTIIWRSQFPFEIHREDISEISEALLEGVKQRHTKQWHHFLPTPDFPPLNMNSCSIINCHFNLSVTVLLNEFNRNLVLKFPVYYGTTMNFDYDGRPRYLDLPDMSNFCYRMSTIPSERSSVVTKRFSIAEHVEETITRLKTRFSWSKESDDYEKNLSTVQCVLSTLTADRIRQLDKSYAGAVGLLDRDTTIDLITALKFPMRISSTMR